MTDKARTFAMAAHGAQTYGDKPYIHHLETVAGILKPYGEEAVIIGYLHDVVEDTIVSIDDIQSAFSEFVADCVAILSDEPGNNRKQRKAKTFQKMAGVTDKKTLALIVKAADRLANIEACQSDNNAGLLRMYKQEHEPFARAVYRPGLCEDIWERINRAVAA